MGAQHILVIDDEFEIRSLVGEYLEAIGYEVRIAASGSEALALLEKAEQPFDLALVDWNLPGISGRDVIEAIQRLSPQTLVVLTTGDPPGVLRSYMASNRCTDVVLKPFTLGQLKDCIQGALANDAVNSAAP